MRLLAAPAQLRMHAIANALGDLGTIGRGARPVVIQGGLSTDASLYEPLRRLLVARGFDVTVTQMPLHGFASLRRDAAALAGAVEAAAQRSLARGGDGLVQVVGHSKGGLAARWYLQRMGGIEQVSQLVTIGTPHNGSAPLGRVATTLLSRMPGLPGVKQLSASSAQVRALNAELPTFMSNARRAQPGFRITSLAGDLDLPGLRGTDLLVSTGSAALDESISGVRNLVLRGGGAHHGAIVGQYGMHEPTLRAAVELLAGRSVDDVSRGASSIASAAA